MVEFIIVLNGCKFALTDKWTPLDVQKACNFGCCNEGCNSTWLTTGGTFADPYISSLARIVECLHCSPCASYVRFGKLPIIRTDWPMNLYKKIVMKNQILNSVTLIEIDVGRNEFLMIYIQGRDPNSPAANPVKFYQMPLGRLAASHQYT